mgnify:CR=1 FL=1
MRAKTAFLAGAGAAYFFDPETGRRRRHVARDRSVKALRRLQGVGVKKVKLVGGHARGIAAISRRAVTRHAVAVDDETVAQRIRSDALRDLRLSTKDIDVSVENNTLTLKGERRRDHEVKDEQLSKNKAWSELNAAMEERQAEFAVLVAAGEESVPVGREQLVEYEGNKMIVAVDPEQPDELGLDLAYRYARLRVMQPASATPPRKPAPCSRPRSPSGWR